ncbi:MAG: MBL fold metallo-hydrolase [Actinobacteria bacterium]|jgi:glyoxylase-like metal-dependent hydrolase (beta-lactamase superfamily II)|nr:MBL fold metallo-hydrolase [Actinomycetota bacterium]MCL6094375.1 MBL fold metallo-hydrolase [Actinomycetota bacterium]
MQYEDAVFHSSPAVLVYKFVVGPFDNNVYVVQSKVSGGSVLIDAAAEPKRLVDICRDLRVTAVLQTHGHADHIQAVPELRRAGFRVGIGSGDADRLPNEHDWIIDDGELIDIGGGVELEAIHTPGHTPGSLCFLLVDGQRAADILFSGDTLFPGGPGNTSLAGGDFATIIESIRTRLFARMPESTLVLPGHGVHTTIGTERPHLTEWIARGW